LGFGLPVGSKNSCTSVTGGHPAHWLAPACCSSNPLRAPYRQRLPTANTLIHDQAFDAAGM
jgi:hypothetical protein